MLKKHANKFLVLKYITPTVQVGWVSLQSYWQFHWQYWIEALCKFLALSWGQTKFNQVNNWEWLRPFDHWLWYTVLAHVVEALGCLRHPTSTEWHACSVNVKIIIISQANDNNYYLLNKACTCGIAWIDHTQSTRNTVWFCFIQSPFQFPNIQSPPIGFIKVIIDLMKNKYN